MIAKINFSPEGSEIPNEFQSDFGEGYSSERGYGWVSQSSLNNENPEPIDISSNTRDRGANSGSAQDTLIHLQYPEDLVSPIAESSVKTPAAWEYNIANGSYLVTVGVGDSNFTDSSHTINIEGESAISDFVPNEDSLFVQATTLVEVTDGQLTIDAVGGDNTKLNFVEIASADDTDTEAPVDSGDDSSDAGDESDDTAIGEDDSSTISETIRVNFTPASAFPLEGYIQDIGGEYSDGQGYGWITEESAGSDNPTPVDISPNTRDRNSVQEDALDSLIHLQYGDAFDNQNSVRTPAAWEYELANGEYTVTVAVGDPDFSNSNHVINVEGNSFISGFTPTEDQLFRIETATVEVTDGKLTIDAIGGENTKLNFVEITPGNTSNNTVSVTPIETPNELPIPVEGGGVVEVVEPVEGGINVNFGTAEANLSSAFTQDVGAAFSDERGYGWVTQDGSTPIDVFANARDRNTLFSDGQGGVFEEPTRDSLIHLQYPTGLGNSEDAITNPVAWEYALANGQYQVTVGVGDPDFVDSNHVINIEGESAISGFTPTGTVENGFLPLDSQAFATATATVEVTDGRLTVDAIGGENTKINYISIVEVSDV